MAESNEYLFIINKTPNKTSKSAISGKRNPAETIAPIKVEAATGISGIGINCKTLLLPTKTNSSPRSILGKSAIFKFFICAEYLNVIRRNILLDLRCCRTGKLVDFS